MKAIKFKLNKDELGYFVQYPDGRVNRRDNEYFIGALAVSNESKWEDYLGIFVNYESAELIELHD